MSTGLVFKQISKVMADIDAISKSRDNKSQGFKFRGIDDVINEIHPAMRKHGIFIVPEVLEEKREERSTKSGGVMTYVILKIKYTFFAEDGSSVSAVMVGEGSDTGDKASNKAQSIALKYACLQVFAIPTEDEKDPDGHSPEFKARQPQPMQTAPTPTQSKKEQPSASKQPDPGAHVIGGGAMKGKTIRELVDEKGLPAAQDYVNRLKAMCEKDDKPLFSWARYMSVELDRLAQEMAANHPSSARQNEEFDSAYDHAAKVAK